MFRIALCNRDAARRKPLDKFLNINTAFAAERVTRRRSSSTALIIVALIPLALRSVKYRPALTRQVILRNNIAHFTAWAASSCRSSSSS